VVTWAERYPEQKLVVHDLSWADRFAEFEDRLHADLGPGWKFEHVGSTSVPGLCAKPVIDIATSVPIDAEEGAVGATLLESGWTDIVALGDHQASFLLDGTVRVAILHLFSADQWPTAHLRLFASWLRSHDGDRDAYASLKSGLVGSGVWGSEYTKAKREFVTEIVNRARAARGLGPVAL
jgi:GrpB-like predicted nucleotidyltransferase (UPF0157 family)